MILQRRRIFVGCEGASEAAYVAHLQKLANARDFAVHLTACDLGGGDPCTLVEKAIRQVKSDVHRRRDPFAHRAICLDSDRRRETPDRTVRALDLAARHKFLLIWQAPNHEGLLLRHLERCQHLRPPNSAQALEVLRSNWPDYAKAASAKDLAERIDQAALMRAAAGEPELAVFLGWIGLVQPTE